MIESAYVAAVASNKTEIFNKAQDYCIGPSVRAKSEDKWLFRDIQVYGNVQGNGKETGTSIGTGGFRMTPASLSKNA